MHSSYLSLFLSVPTSTVCAIQAPTLARDSGASHTSRNMADLSRRSMSRQYSRRSPAPPGAAPQQSSTAPAKAAEDTAARASDGTTSKEEKGKSVQEGASASSQQAGPLSQVPQSPFEHWRSGGDSAHRDQPKVNAYQALDVTMHTWSLTHGLLPKAQVSQARRQAKNTRE